MTYTLTFSEDMNDSTVGAADFFNAGNAAITIGAITETSPGVFSVEVTPTSTGLLRLAVAAGAALQDAQGDALNTTHAIIDDTVVTVNLPDETVPNVVGMDQSAAEAAIVAANLVVGTIRQIYDEVVPLGDVYSQNPVGGSSLPGQYPVNLVISIGPPPDTTASGDRLDRPGRWRLQHRGECQPGGDLRRECVRQHRQHHHPQPQRWHRHDHPGVRSRAGR